MALVFDTNNEKRDKAKPENKQKKRYLMMIALTTGRVVVKSGPIPSSSVAVHEDNSVTHNNIRNAC